MVFARKGYDNSSVREIIGATNLGAGTFYNYFPDKLSIFKSINERIVADFSHNFLREIKKSTTFEEIIQIAFSTWFNWISDKENDHLFIKNNKQEIEVLSTYSQARFIHKFLDRVDESVTFKGKNVETIK